MGWYKKSDIDPEKLDWAERHNVEISPDGKFVLYHGTTHGDKIRSSGFFNSGTLFAQDPREAYNFALRSYHKQSGKGIEVLTVLVPPNLVACGIWCQALREIPLEIVKSQTYPISGDVGNELV